MKSNFNDANPQYFKSLLAWPLSDKKVKRSLDESLSWAQVLT